MVRRATIGVVMAAMAFSGSLASAARGAEWHTNGHKAFSLTNAGAVRFALHSQGSTIPLGCSGAYGSGTLKGPTVAGSAVPGAATVTLQFVSPCIVFTMAGFDMVCSPAEFNAIGYSGGTTLATAGGGVTMGSLTNIDCTFRNHGSPCATISGSVSANYINPNPIAAGAGTLAVTRTGQSLTWQGLGIPCILSPNPLVLTFGKPTAGADVADLTFPVDGPGAPYLFRTP
jgi:hypothetical protein